jgi:hypothetical protein
MQFDLPAVRRFFGLVVVMKRVTDDETQSTYIAPALGRQANSHCGAKTIVAQKTSNLLWSPNLIPGQVGEKS